MTSATVERRASMYSLKALCFRFLRVIRKNWRGEDGRKKRKKEKKGKGKQDEEGRGGGGVKRVAHDVENNVDGGVGVEAIEEGVSKDAEGVVTEKKEEDGEGKRGDRRAADGELTLGQR